MKCDKCGLELLDEWKYCSGCGRSVADIKKKVQYRKAHGSWQVTTEGDVEGKSTKYLGTYTGFIDEIALKLANQSYYSLTFTPVEPLEKMKPGKSVHVHLDVNSGTWEMTPKERVAYYQKILVGRPVVISESNYYASVVISTK